MKKWKQLLSGALASIMLLGSTTMMRADDNAPTYNTVIQIPLYQDGATSAQTKAGNRAAANREVIKKAIYDGLMDCQRTIDVERFGIYENEVMDYIWSVINSSPELFYVESGVTISLRYDGIITRITPTYSATGTSLAQQRATYNEKMQEILALVDRNWSDLEKIVFLHDYLAQNYVYVLDENNGENTNYDAYGFLTERHGVCQAYTLVYLGLLKELDINTAIADSEKMNHIWNLVQLNGKWYHVDVTWDDPVPDNYGNANHNYLLLSDAAINRAGHYSWTAEYQCTDTTYDYNYFWTQFSSPFTPLNGKWYTTGYLPGDDYDPPFCFVCSVDFYQPNVTGICELGLWNVPDSSYFSTTSHSGLGTYDNKPYFNTESSIVSYDPSKDAQDAFEILFTPSAGKTIWGMRLQGSDLQYELTTLDIDGNYIVTSDEEFRSVELPPPESPMPLSPGDIDGDGQITITDAFIALKYAMGTALLSNSQKTAANMNSDEYITLNDVQIILRHAMHIDTSMTP